MEVEKYEDFIKRCEEDDYNVVKKWDYEHFRICCNKCQSNDVIIFFREESGCMGSEYTGYMHAFNWDNGMIVKCKHCGNAMAMEL